MIEIIQLIILLILLIVVYYQCNKRNTSSSNASPEPINVYMIEYEVDGKKYKMLVRAKDSMGALDRLQKKAQFLDFEPTNIEWRKVL